MSKRLVLEVSDEFERLLAELAAEENAPKSEIMRRGLSLMEAFRRQRNLGRTHIGFTADPSKLEAEMLGILNAPVAPPAAGAGEGSQRRRQAS